MAISYTRWNTAIKQWYRGKIRRSWSPQQVRNPSKRAPKKSSSSTAAARLLTGSTWIDHPLFVHVCVFILIPHRHIDPWSWSFGSGNTSKQQVRPTSNCGARDDSCVAGANPALQTVQSNQFEIKWWNSTTWSREARWRRPELKRFQVATPSPLDHHGSSSLSKRNPMWGEYPVFRLTHMLFKDVQKVLMTVRWQNIWPSRALNEKISPLIPLLLQSGLTEVPFRSISWIVSITKQSCGWTVSLFLYLCLITIKYLSIYLSIYLSTSFYLHSIQVYIPHDKHIFFSLLFFPSLFPGTRASRAAAQQLLVRVMAGAPSMSSTSMKVLCTCQGETKIWMKVVNIC